MEKKQQVNIIALAKKKLAQRGISETMVRGALENPDQIVAGHGGRIVVQKKQIFNGKEYLLRVVYEENNNQATVITAYLTSSIARYWEE